MMNYVKLLGLIFVLTNLITLSTTPAANLPGGFCYTKQCDGTHPITGFDFWKKVQSYGDPNGNGPLGPNFMAPVAEGSTQTESVPSNDFFNQMTDAENYSSSQCGLSLNSNTNDSIVIAGPCKTASDLDRKGNIVKMKHKPQGNPGLNAKQMDVFFEAAKAKKDQLPVMGYCRPDGIGLQTVECYPYTMDLGDPAIFAVGSKAEACYKTYVPKVGGNSICRVGIPAGSRVDGLNNASFFVALFGNKFDLLKAEAVLTAPLSGNVSYNGTVYYLGNKIYSKPTNAADIRVEDNVPIAAIEKGITIPFPIGPLTLSVSAGVQGNASFNMGARVVSMWANGRVRPIINTSGYVDAGLDAWIAKAGVEGHLTFLNNDIDVYGFNGIASTPSSQGEYLAYSVQVSGLDTLSALSGWVGAYAKIRVPKFLGFRWKKWGVKIFDWGGVTTSGYVFNKFIPATSVWAVKNKLQ